MNEREGIINFLLQACDRLNLTITGLQAKIAELEKNAAPAEVKPEIVA